VLSFTYPQEPRDTELAEGEIAPQGPNAVELAAVNDPYAVLDPAELNYAWEAKGDRALLPNEVYDDGDATFLTWNADATLPAILVTNAEGDEGPVNYAVRGDTIVVDGVPREITLRSGRESATLSNRGPAREPRRPAIAQARGTNPTATEVK
jgi:type IV secretion system protein VirB9